jgi:heme/copper-type cytochrome/quinol oxidase subunit 2
MKNNLYIFGCSFSSPYHEETEEYRKYKNDPKFNYVLMCNKICGGAHYKMKMIVVVLEEKD